MFVEEFSDIELSVSKSGWSENFGDFDQNRFLFAHCRPHFICCHNKAQQKRAPTEAGKSVDCSSSDLVSGADDEEVATMKRAAFRTLVAATRAVRPERKPPTLRLVVSNPRPVVSAKAA